MHLRHVDELKAILAVAHTMLVVIWQVRYDAVDHVELGADHLERRSDPEAHARRFVRQLEELGHRVSLEPAA